jgi:predicted nucleic acid-binding protein
VSARVVTEVCFLLEREAGPSTEAEFLRSVREGDLRLECPTTDDLGRMVELAERYGNHPVGATDASVVAIAERRKLARLATLDHRDFAVVRPCQVASFEVVLSAASLLRVAVPCSDNDLARL